MSKLEAQERLAWGEQITIPRSGRWVKIPKIDETIQVQWQKRDTFEKVREACRWNEVKSIVKKVSIRAKGKNSNRCWKGEKVNLSWISKRKGRNRD